MFRDNSLIPAEAIRLAALGMLAEAPRRMAISPPRSAISPAASSGPSLELMGTSIELLRYEGLIEASTARAQPTMPCFASTSAARRRCKGCCARSCVAPIPDFNRLALLLKLRFLHHLLGRGAAHPARAHGRITRERAGAPR